MTTRIWIGPGGPCGSATPRRHRTRGRPSRPLLPPRIPLLGVRLLRVLRLLGVRLLGVRLLRVRLLRVLRLLGVRLLGVLLLGVRLLRVLLLGVLLLGVRLLRVLLLGVRLLGVRLLRWVLKVPVQIRTLWLGSAIVALVWCGMGRIAKTALWHSGVVPLRPGSSKVEPGWVGRIVGPGGVGAPHLGSSSGLRIEVAGVEVLIFRLTHDTVSARLVVPISPLPSPAQTTARITQYQSQVNIQSVQ